MSDNPCLACPTQQSCCTNLIWTRLSPQEYERHFARYDDRIECLREGPIHLVQTRDGGACPHWDGECSIYEDRPMECRLFPHSIGSVFDGKTLTLSVHSRTPCPWRDTLKMPDEEALALVRDFARSLARKDQSVRVYLQEGTGLAETWWRRLWRKTFGIGRFSNAFYKAWFERRQKRQT